MGISQSSLESIQEFVQLPCCSEKPSGDVEGWANRSGSAVSKKTQDINVCEII